MISALRMSTAIGLAGLAVSLTAGTALAADPPLPGLVNLNFEDYTGSSPKNYFTNVDPVGWTGGSGLIFIDSTTIPGASAADITYLQTYANPVGAYSGNYVEADGNPTYESGFNYEVTGLTVGQTYSLSFYQGASQQTGFVGDTTNQWIVSLGTAGLSLACCGPTDPTYGATDYYYSTDPNASIAASPLMSVKTGTAVGWDYVTVTLKADATSDLLSFLAWGDNGSTVNLPPMAFLAGVDSPPGLGASTPEPATWAMMGIGFLGVAGMSYLRRRTARVAVAS